MSDYVPDELKLHIKDELEPAKNRGFYICPLCGSGTGVGKGRPDGALKITADGKKWHCFACNEGGDIIDLVQARDGMSKQDAREMLMQRYGIRDERKEARAMQQAKRDFAPVKEEIAPAQKDATREHYIEACAHAIAGTVGESYFHARGLDDHVITTYRLGYDKASNAVVIPYPGTDYYTTRSINGKEYRKPTGVQEPLYLIANGNVNESSVLFVTEGQIDAMSLAQAGASLVAAIGGAGASKLESMAIRAKRAIIVSDNDEPGAKTAERIKETLEHKGIQCLVVGPPPQYGVKDSNELLQKNPRALAECVAHWYKAAQEKLEVPTDNVAEYLTSNFGKDIEHFRLFKDRKTGYSNLDAETSLYPGLYVLGAISSLGKTTFAHQMCDQIAKTGTKVVYFSLEQTRLEMVSKGLARLTAQKDFDKGVSAINIREGNSTPAVSAAINDYMAFADNINLVQCSFETTIDTITNYVQDFIKETKSTPVVVVDYLQIIKPIDPKQTTKDAVDGHVRALKKLQSDNDLVLIVISSLNRSNYLTPVDFESFKESGGIEYTADVVWGLQLQVINGDLFEKKDKLKEKREAVRQAKLESPRRIELVCLKNRYGKSSYSCNFSYYPQYDLFVPESDFGPIAEKDVPFKI